MSCLEPCCFRRAAATARFHREMTCQGEVVVIIVEAVEVLVLVLVYVLLLVIVP